MEENMLSTDMLINIITATIAGFMSRWSVLRIDYRQYPTFPNGYLIHLAVGFVASASGAIAIPALMAKDFTAVTFLLLAIQQFRDVRKMERTSLDNLERSEYHPRGEAYINGIAKTFEARNYLAMIVSLTTSAILLMLSQAAAKYIAVFASLVAAFIVHMIIGRFLKGRCIGDIANIQTGDICFKDTNLYLNNILMNSIEPEEKRQRILKYGIGVILEPKGKNEKIELNNSGQIKAILHECSRLLGLEDYIETKRDFKTGLVFIVIIPIRKEPESLLNVIKNVPLLETLKKQAGTNTKKRTH
jgi:uncharacterized protein